MNQSQHTENFYKVGTTINKIKKKRDRMKETIL